MARSNNCRDDILDPIDAQRIFVAVDGSDDGAPGRRDGLTSNNGAAVDNCENLTSDGS